MGEKSKCKLIPDSYRYVQQLSRCRAHNLEEGGIILSFKMRQIAHSIHAKCMGDRFLCTIEEISSHLYEGLGKVSKDKVTLTFLSEI